MTDIQIKYWDLEEGKRHNVVTEGETYRHNVIGESQNLLSLSETKRHNVTSEGIASREASTHVVQANAAVSQAKSAAKQADTSRLLALSNVAYNSAKTEGTKIANEVASASKIASIVGNYGSAAGSVLGAVGSVVKSIIGIAGLTS